MDAIIGALQSTSEHIKINISTLVTRKVHLPSHIGAELIVLFKMRMDATTFFQQLSHDIAAWHM